MVLVPPPPAPIRQDRRSSGSLPAEENDGYASAVCAGTSARRRVLPLAREIGIAARRDAEAMRSDRPEGAVTNGLGHGSVLKRDAVPAVASTAR